MKRYVPIIIGVVALCAVLYLGSSKVSDDEVKLANDEIKIDISSKNFQGSFTKMENTLQYGFDIPETAAAAVTMDGALVKIADMGTPVLAMYVSYEGVRGYSPLDYAANNIAPKVSGVTQKENIMIGEYEWTVVESANSEWHIASVENGKWLLVVENTKVESERALPILETMLVTSPVKLVEESASDTEQVMEVDPEATSDVSVFEK